MDGLEQIQIVYYILLIIVLLLTFSNRIKLYEYLKKIGKLLIAKIKQLIVFVRELPSLWNISMENSQNYESLIDFKIDKIEMQIRYQGNKLCPQITQEGPDLPHQKTISGEIKLEGLHYT